ncbi:MULTISPECIES: dihydroorotase family protein [unclassified Mesorhizobium]|uniref:dihydroorotase n=1 Tax=unclassified Mesorhizobium TaxID=325217 RepID=UPI000FD758E8|nr:MULTISPECIES: dihydroorotase family protein [unclassified Mesorhizobium]TGQ17299.1 dihydroorotase [Mesorhizobium sp. M2E.F.Ca.ET.219.01.1.1]TGT76544.1 dihydroorotase [Mesorhizobium sp. M2E.F.Ca.ET.166.01.1.1]TGW02658.1 dihydroorotase [Mesorhizobium sp. M2E.F.Ca.ET.154.01.1.1]
MFDTLIRGGTLVNADGVSRGDIGIAAGKVAAIVAPGEAAEAGTVIDASGCFLLPGLVDAHAHLREPGLTHKENFSSGTHAAALGGVTTVLDMPTDEPWTATAEQLVDKMATAANRIHVDVGLQAVVGRDLSLIPRLLDHAPVSFELFTADVPDGFLFATLDSVAEALKAFAGADTLVGISPGDQSILTGSTERDRSGTIAAFLDSRPPLAEANGIARALVAAASAEARIHVRQINSELGVETWSRLRGVADASVETTPQNLFFTAQDYETQGAKLKASPPLRFAHDVDALRAALSAGLIDIVATDHAPHAPAEKAAPYAAFADIPGGMPGLQTLLATMLRLVDEGLIALSDLVRMCSRNPSERFGLGRRKGKIAAGYDADLLILDPRRSSTIASAEQVSRAGYTPFDGWAVKARLTNVFLRGREIVRDGRLVGPAQGKIVTRES